MRVRSTWGILLLTGALIPLASCSNNPELNSISVNPGTVTTTPTNGLRVYFTAIGSYTRPGHQPITKDITTAVTWTSAAPQFVNIDANTGVAIVTGYGTGNINIYAAAPGFHGDVVGAAIFNIQQVPSSGIQDPSSGGGARSLSLVPVREQAGSPTGAVQFTAVGKTEDGTSVKLAGQPIWTSTDSEVATIDKAGVLTTLGPGKTTITAVYTNPDGTTAVGKVSFNAAQ